jgi:hypothetical protein
MRMSEFSGFRMAAVILFIALILAMFSGIARAAPVTYETNVLSWDGSKWARLTKGYLLTAQSPTHATLAIGGGYGDTGLSVAATGALTSNSTALFDGSITSGKTGANGSIIVKNAAAGATYFSASGDTGNVVIKGDIAVNTDKLAITGANGSINIGPDKFTVAGASGNTVIAGTATITGELTGAGPKHYLSVPLNSTAGATTAYTGVIAVQRGMTITKASVAFWTYPGSSAGTCVFTLTNHDASGGADDNLLNAANVDIKAKAAHSVTDLTLTATGADLVLAAGDAVYATCVNDNGDATAGVGGVLTLEYTLQ